MGKNKKRAFNPCSFSFSLSILWSQHLSHFFSAHTPSCLPCEQAAACDAYPVNVVFLIDGSASISDEDFDEARDWILTVVDTFNPGMGKKIKLGLFKNLTCD